MGINFLHPFYLLLFVPAAFLIIHWWRAKSAMPFKRRALVAGMRTVLFMLLILALAGTQLVTPVRAETVIFVVDRSASMKADSRIPVFLQDAVNHKQPIDQYGIVSVGQTAGVEQPITTRTDVTQLGVDVGPHATNLAEGIRLAAGMIPSTARGKIVLLSDGLATHGDALTEIALAKERGIAFEAVSLQQPQADEVVLSSVQIPDHLYLGEAFEIKAEVESTVATHATLRLYEGNQEVGKQAVQLEKGKNRFVFPEVSRQEGFHRYRVEVFADRDSTQVNNQAFAYTVVDGTPKVLIVEGHQGAATNLVNALQAGSVTVERKPPELLPKELEGYKQYASIVLADVEAMQLKQADMERIRTAVSDLGLGLIMTGGKNSFGMGGWFKTPIEEALPVYMDLRGKEKLPSLGLMLVIDKSGSMDSGLNGGNKMALAREAAIRATEMLNEKDQVGVIAFDGSPWEVVPPQPVTNLPEIQEQIGRIRADGGTDIYPALQMAYQQIKGVNTQRKHVILLTDGQSGRTDDYVQLLKNMTNENITVSTVAVGDDADTALLEDLAKLGEGRYYAANDPSTIPQIFSKETALASRTFIVEKPQVPIQSGGSDLAALRQGVPPIHAYIATTPKTTAEQVLTSADTDPILARWQYGLGRAVAWTSDLEGQWAPQWVAWAGNSKLWSDLVSWTLPQVNNGEWRTETRLDGLQGTIDVTMPAGAPMPQSMEAVVVNDQLKREVVTLKATAPGKWSGAFAAGEPGTYLMQVLKKQGDSIVASQTAGLTISYSPEYAIRQDGEERLKEMVQTAEGALITQPAAVFSGQLAKKSERQSIAEWLLLLAALLWPLDIALRRLQLPEMWWQRMKQFVFGQRKVATAGPAPASVFQQLAASKERASHGSAAASQVRTVTHQTMAGKPSVSNEHSLNKPSADRPATTSSQAKASASTPADSQSDAFNRLLEAKKRKQK